MNTITHRSNITQLFAILLILMISGYIYISETDSGKAYARKGARYIRDRNSGEIINQIMKDNVSWIRPEYMCNEEIRHGDCGEFNYFGLNLTQLALLGDGITDLSTLSGVNLELLQFNAGDIADFSPLEGMPLKFLAINNGYLLDNLYFLKNMPLITLYLVDLPRLPRTDVGALELKDLTAIYVLQSDAEKFYNVPSSVKICLCNKLGSQKGKLSR